MTVLVLLAADVRAEGGYYAGEFMNLGAGARATGMGNTYVALVDDATASYWNPAGLARLKRKEIALMHAVSQFGGLVQYDFASYGVPVKGIGGVAVSLVRLAVNDIKETYLADPDAPIGDENPILVASTFRNSDYCLFVSQGRHFENLHLAAGASAKLFRREFGDYYGHGIGFDVGLQYQPVPNLQLGLTLKDITWSTISYSDGVRDHIPPSLHAGISYTTGVLDLLLGTLTLSAGSFALSELPGSRNFILSENLGLDNGDYLEPIAAGGLGVEYNLKDIFFVRLGSVQNNQSIGIGLVILEQYRIDTALVLHSLWDNQYAGDLGPTFRVSTNIGF